MSNFSERMGITKPRAKIQTESIDPELRNCLWNQLSVYWSENRTTLAMSADMESLAKVIWDSFFKQPIDIIPSRYSDAYQAIRYNYFNMSWFQVYDFIEFLVNNYRYEPTNISVIKNCNAVLEKEVSGYRFIGKRITPITSKEEISEIETALETPLKTVNTHFQNALNLLSDRETPDYRNSIKESISAVEAICKVIAHNENTTLGAALTKIEREGNITLHPSLKNAFSDLYSYTSDADGIRHAFKDDKVNADFEEAKFMMVACSAFVNYLVSKASKLGISINL